MIIPGQTADGDSSGLVIDGKNTTEATKIQTENKNKKGQQNKRSERNEGQSRIDDLQQMAHKRKT